MMNEPNSLDTALQLEEIKLIELAEATATQRQNDLTALERNLAAKDGAISGGRLTAETDIIFSQFESTIEALISYRKQLATKVPALLQSTHLKEFQAKLDHHIDLALNVLQRRCTENSSLKLMPAPAIEAILKRARMRADSFKGSLNNRLQAMALEGALGMHRERQQNVTNLKISHSTIANLNLGTVVGDLNGSIQTLTTAGQTDLADAVRQLSDAIAVSSELDDNTKKEMLETVAYVSEQATLPAESRELGPLRASLLMIKENLGTIVGLTNLVLKLEESLKHSGMPHF